MAAANNKGSAKPPPGRPFQKGQSGNPSGRPKIVGEIRDIARQHTADAMTALAQIVKDKKAPQSARVAAATQLLDRGYGKPTQHIEANVNLLERMTDDDRRALEQGIDAILATREAGIGETSH